MKKIISLILCVTMLFSVMLIYVTTVATDNSALVQASGKTIVNQSMLTSKSGNYGALAKLSSVFYARIDCVHCDDKYFALWGPNNNAYNVIIYPDHDSKDKYWKFERNDDDTYRIINMYPINDEYKCLEVEEEATTVDSNVKVENIYDGSLNQKWYIYSYYGRYVIKSACSDYVLEVEGAETAQGTKVQLGTFSGKNHQLFKLAMVYGTQVDLGTVFYARIGSVHSGKYLALDSQRNYSVIIYDSSTYKDQIWKFERYDDGSYKITNMYPINDENKCLEVANGANADGADAIVNTDDGSNKQKWYIYSYNGNYVFKADCSDRVLDVTESKTDNYTNVQTYTFNGTQAQQFTIEMVYGNQVDLGTDFYA